MRHFDFNAENLVEKFLEASDSLNFDYFGRMLVHLIPPPGLTQSAVWRCISFMTVEVAGISQAGKFKGPDFDFLDFFKDSTKVLSDLINLISCFILGNFLELS